MALRSSNLADDFASPSHRILIVKNTFIVGLPEDGGRSGFASQRGSRSLPPSFRLGENVVWAIEEERAPPGLTEKGDSVSTTGTSQEVGDDSEQFLSAIHTGHVDANVLRIGDRLLAPSAEAAVAATKKNPRSVQDEMDRLPWGPQIVTVMVRQVPRRYSQAMFLEEIVRQGFGGHFDFLYLPNERTKGGRLGVGFCFINFIAPHLAHGFREKMDGAYLDDEMVIQGKSLKVHPASRQGYEANYRYFSETKTLGQNVEWGPLFFPGGSIMIPPHGDASAPQGLPSFDTSCESLHPNERLMDSALAQQHSSAAATRQHGGMDSTAMEWSEITDAFNVSEDISMGAMDLSMDQRSYLWDQLEVEGMDLQHQADAQQTLLPLGEHLPFMSSDFPVADEELACDGYVAEPPAFCNEEQANPYQGLPIQIDGLDSGEQLKWGPDIFTVMVRQIPRQYTQPMFLWEILNRGFAGKFDFLYLPSDRSKKIHVGIGFSFINFISPDYVHEFRAQLDGVYLDDLMRSRGKPLRIHPASRQGYRANFEHFAQTKIGQDAEWGPLFFPEGIGMDLMYGEAAMAMHTAEEVGPLAAAQALHAAVQTPYDVSTGNYRVPPESSPTMGPAPSSAEHWLGSEPSKQDGFCTNSACLLPIQQSPTTFAGKPKRRSRQAGQESVQQPSTAAGGRLSSASWQAPPPNQSQFARPRRRGTVQ